MASGAHKILSRSRKMLLKNRLALSWIILVILAACSAKDPFEPEPYYDQENYVTIHGLKTCYLEQGHGQALVFVHGWAGNAFNFMDVFDDMALEFHVFVLDLPGSGKSGCLPEFNYDLGFYADFVEKFMDAIGIEKAHLVGHSMGGHIAAIFALEHPERLYKLVLVDAAGVDTGSSLMSIGSKIITPSLVIPMIHLVFPVTEEKLERVPHSEKNRVLLAEERYSSVVRACTGQALSQSMKSIVRYNVTERLSQIKAPTMVVWCEDDELVPLENAYIFQKGIPEAKLVIIKSCGHTPMQCRPDQFTSALKKFLASP
jgi:pimeloyl-ACP methyl ester carboxylesterase